RWITSVGSALGDAPSSPSVPPPTTRSSQPIASHAPIPRPRRRRGGSASTAAVWISSPDAKKPESAVSSTMVSRSLGGGSGTTDPGVEDEIQDVDEAVHEDEAGRQHEDEPLQLDVRTARERVEDLLAHPGNLEDHFDDDGAADERADVQPGDGEQREARGSERVPPKDAAVRDPLRLRHQDEILLQRRDHVTTKQAHIDGDLTGGERDRGQHHVADVLTDIGVTARAEERVEPAAVIVAHR